MNEFDVIETYFKGITGRKTPWEVKGIGDDGAVLGCPAHKECVVSTDTLVSGVHFMPDWPPSAIGRLALAVNLSDLAAMGAKPRWVTMALTLPELNEPWLKDFSAGFGAMAKKDGVTLIGGDLTRGPLSITLTVIGWVDCGTALLRSTAVPGDTIYVTGPLGGAALAAATLLNKSKVRNRDDRTLLDLLMYPEPRMLHSVLLLPAQHACIDISDGLIADLGHILKQSNVGASVSLPDVPIHPMVQKRCSEAQALQFAMTGGGDYELCFTLPLEEHIERLLLMDAMNLPYYPIGIIEKKRGLRLIDHNECEVPFEKTGFQHFE